jgi:hypothetical protein
MPLILYILLIPVAGIFISFALTKKLATAEFFFGVTWIFVLISAEISNTGLLYQYKWYHTDFGLKLIFYTLLASSLGFVMASLVMSLDKYKMNRLHEINFKIFDSTFVIKNIRKIRIVILVLGTISFFLSYYAHGNSIYSIRVETLEESSSLYRIFNYLLYSSFPVLILLGLYDGSRGRINYGNYLFVWSGLVLHGLAIGARINILVGAVVYILGYLTNSNSKFLLRDTFKLFGKVVVIALFVFGFIGLVRAPIPLSERIKSRDILNQYGLFSLISYVSDSVVATGPHSRMALSYEPQGGKFLFDGFYRMMRKFDLVDPLPDDIFGHQYFRRTEQDGPLGWSQTNSIPKMVADFGLTFFPFGFFIVSFVAQILSLKAKSSDLFFKLISTWFVLCSIYSVQASMWFSAQSMVVFFICFLITRNFNKVYK